LSAVGGGAVDSCPLANMHVPANKLVNKQA